MHTTSRDEREIYIKSLSMKVLKYDVVVSPKSIIRSSEATAEAKWTEITH